MTGSSKILNNKIIHSKKAHNKILKILSSHLIINYKLPKKTLEKINVILIVEVKNIISLKLFGLLV